MKIHSFHYLIILIQENKASNSAMIFSPLCFSKPFFSFLQKSVIRGLCLAKNSSCVPCNFTILIDEKNRSYTLYGRNTLLPENYRPANIRGENTYKLRYNLEKV